MRSQCSQSVTATSQAGLLLIRKSSTIGVASVHLLHMPYDDAANGRRIKKEKGAHGLWCSAGCDVISYQ